MELEKFSFHLSLYPIIEDAPIISIEDDELSLRIVDPVLQLLVEHTEMDLQHKALDASNWLLVFLYIAESNYLSCR